ncbi:MAG: branched chain amino acid aminotransferase [Bacteroidetes bacterium RIFCSPLOWO2_02_FULL_36_8]|nr:MAG: branched chain amino acid aminotransferase [Bacteroidetes bacterium RIFCSPLOWO2_02_FULL_36_8]OFY70610.1 MAG: branched chain amino acid aminotransferase [Bacteroidetes bacterium RIFCSPLOWO2_12_FULL_37_12]
MLETKIYNLEIQKVTKSRIHEIDFNHIPFGKYFSDHMFVVDYKNEEWQDGKIVPYGPMSMAPSISALHYGQALFEGMKAYKDTKGNSWLFRPTDNHARLNISAERLCMPAIPEDLFMQGLMELIRLDSNWIPKQENAALYIRPVMFAIDEFVGVKPSQNYRFVIFTCPVGQYYSEPVSVLVETKYVRAFEGGLGFTKAAANYAAALMPAKLGQSKGYHQMLWTDGFEHKYIEESGTMNVMFVIGNKVVTPMTSGTILSGITRDSIIQLLKDWGIPVEERRISIDDLLTAHSKNELKEAFGVGTAATVAHIAKIGYMGKDFQLPVITPSSISHRILKTLTDIRTGKCEDKFGWMVRV